jgi:hypothetical protein
LEGSWDIENPLRDICSARKEHGPCDKIGGQGIEEIDTKKGELRMNTDASNDIIRYVSADDSDSTCKVQ